MTYEEAVSYLYETPKFTKKNSLEHTRRLLGWLGHPEESFPIIHVAGSNGKGSVCSYIDSILKEAGMHRALFISPHLETIRERFRVDGEMISEEDFLEIFLEIKKLLDEHPETEHPTFFEYLFLMAMLYFRKEKVEVAVLETGLGGRLDATNAPLHPKATVITSISLEHTEYLGNTIEEITGEKAGIIKEGVPIIYDASLPEAASVIGSIAKSKEAPAFPVTEQAIKNVRLQAEGIDFSYASKYDELDISIQNKADYQLMNASLATETAMHLLERDDKKDLIESGIRKAFWPGRMEEKEKDIYLDGAHNPDGVKKFLQSAKKIAGDRKAVLLFSALEDKHPDKIIAIFAESDLWKKIIVTKIDSARAADPKMLTEEFIKRVGTDRVSCIPELEKALSKAIEEKGDDLLFCSGSLYLIGELEKLL
jgi:dihydrofolate synthase / folylpolyglutamate synthase